MAPQAEGFLRHSSFCNVSGEKVGRRPYVGVLGGAITSSLQISEDSAF